jgi:bifunctional pyridoxal-dependent enzyme with beta-cystathionase and maltose regulon repressor activities/acetylornithine deacetylase/succinyl-diaminopimelate desuccinylase-like protein
VVELGRPAASPVVSGLGFIAALTHSAPPAGGVAGGIKVQARAVVSSALPDPADQRASEYLECVSGQRRLELPEVSRSPQQAVIECEVKRQPGGGGVEQAGVGLRIRQATDPAEQERVDRFPKLPGPGQPVAAGCDRLAYQARLPGPLAEVGGAGQELSWRLAVPVHHRAGEVDCRPPAHERKHVTILTGDDQPVKDGSPHKPVTRSGVLMPNQENKPGGRAGGAATVPPLSVLRQRRTAKWREFPADVLPLHIAETDFDLAPPVRAVLEEAVRLSDTGYPAGAAEAAAALAQFAGGFWGWAIDPAKVGLVSDVGVGCVEMLRAVCHPGDRVVICPPVYPPLFDWLREASAELAEVPLRRLDSGEWRLDVGGLSSAFASGAAAIVLCNPHNPVGRVHSREELTEVAALAASHRVMVICDEIHAPLVLPGAEFTPFLSVPQGDAVGVSLLSASKAWNIPGLKCAAIVAASEQMYSIVASRPAHNLWRGRIGNLGVLGFTAAFKEGTPWLLSELGQLDHRRTQLARLLEHKLPAVTWTPPEATYLGWLDCRAYGPEDQPQRLFLNQARVALDPGPKFGAGASGWARITFATSSAVLDEAVKRMASVPSHGIRRPRGRATEHQMTTPREHIAGHREEFLADLDQWLRIPGISAQPGHHADVQRSAEWFTDAARRAGFPAAEVWPTAGLPACYAEWRSGDADAPTVLVYGHHDVQPVDPVESWRTDPFVPEIDGDLLRARGASDDKGQILCHLLGLGAHLAAAGRTSPAVTLKFLIEGEEESGSPNLRALLAQQRERLSCDLVVVTDTAMLAADTPSTVTGMRGLVSCTVDMHGPSLDLHSGVFGGAVPNPAAALARLAGALHDEQGRVNIPGFYDDVAELSSDDRALLAKVPHDPAEFLAVAKSRALSGEAGYSTLERLGARPTAEVNGIWGGYLGNGRKTVVPADAHLKLSFRLVANQDPATITASTEQFVADHTPAGINHTITWDGDGLPPCTVPLGTLAYTALTDAISRAFDGAPVLPTRSGGSGPAATIQAALNVPLLFLGVGLPDDQIHAPNEKASLSMLYRGAEAVALLWDNLAQQPKRQRRL